MDQGKQESRLAGMDHVSYLKERDQYVDQFREACRLYDGAVLTLAAGAFGVSVTVVEKIGHSLVPAMVAAWGLFAVSIVSTLGSFFASQAACNKRLDNLETAYKRFKGAGGAPSPSAPNEGSQAEYYSALTKWLNRISLGSFILGLTLFSIFVSVNLCKQGDAVMDNGSKITKINESVTPPPAKQNADGRGFPTVRPAQTPPTPPPTPSTETGGSGQPKQ